MSSKGMQKWFCVDPCQPNALQLAKIPIKTTIECISRQFLKHLIHKGKREVVFLGGFILFPIINTHSSLGSLSYCYELFLVILHDNSAPFLGTHWTGLTHSPSKMG